MDFSKKLYYIRTSKGISQNDLSQKTGLRQASLSSYELSKASPTLSSVEKIARALEVPISEFFPSNKNVNLYPGEETLINDFRDLNDDHRQFIKNAIAIAKSSLVYQEGSKPE